MKKVVSVLLCLILLLSLAACGGGTSSSEEPVKTEAEKLAEIFRGVIRVEEEDGAYIPLRFTDKELEAYAKDPTMPYSKCTTGVRMDFYTDAADISFRFSPNNAYHDNKEGFPSDSFDIYENGEYKTSVTASFMDSNREVAYTRTSTEAESRITIVFPMRHEIRIHTLSLGNYRPYTDYEYKILFFGDSITQGLFAEMPSENYVDQVCRELNADYLNLAVGGEKFRFEALTEDVPFAPDHIVIALGTNDKHQHLSLPTIEKNCNQYCDRITRLYPNVPVTFITPFEDQGQEHVDMYTKTAEKYGFKVVDGRTLIPAVAENFNPDGVHPSSTGFALITRNLLPLLKQNMGI